MKASLCWLGLICATAWLCATQVGEAAAKTRCSWSSIHATIEVGGNNVVLNRMTICSNGVVTLSGRGVKCKESGTRVVRVQGRVARTSGILCR